VAEANAKNTMTVRLTKTTCLLCMVEAPFLRLDIAIWLEHMPCSDTLDGQQEGRKHLKRRGKKT
jgi:hypothetical protein